VQGSHDTCSYIYQSPLDVGLWIIGAYEEIPIHQHSPSLEWNISNTVFYLLVPLLNILGLSINHLKKEEFCRLFKLKRKMLSKILMKLRETVNLIFLSVEIIIKHISVNTLHSPTGHVHSI
jgi:hypothetical protein